MITFALSIRYNMKFSAKDLAKRTFEEMERAGPVSPEDRAAFGPQLLRLFHDVHPGDIITAVYLPKGGAVFYYNGARQGLLADRPFAKRFFNIWLAPGCSEPEMRNGLLATR